MQRHPTIIVMLSLACLLVACEQKSPKRVTETNAETGTVIPETAADAPNEKTPTTADSLEISGFSGGMVKVTLTASGTILIGNVSAPRLMIFSDYDCTYCRRFSTTDVPWLEQKTIPGTFAIEHVFVPMSNDGESAARLAVCGAEQGKFSHAHRWLSTHAIHAIDQKKFAATLGLNLAKLAACVRRKELLIGHLQKTIEFGVERVPYFVLGKDSWLGLLRQQELRGRIDKGMNE